MEKLIQYLEGHLLSLYIRNNNLSEKNENIKKFNYYLSCDTLAKVFLKPLNMFIPENV